MYMVIIKMFDIADVLATFPSGKRGVDLDSPSANPPPDIQPNLNNPRNKNVMSMVVITICMVMSILLTLSRAYARLICIKKVYLEDFLVASSLAIYIAYNCCIYRIIDVLGMFVHQWETPIRSLTKFLWFGYLTEIFYVIVVACLKIAVLLDWIRIFVPTGTRNLFFWTCHILLWLNLLFYFTCLIAFNLACFPRQKIWDKTIEGGWCLDPWTMILSTGILNLISDFIILLAPQWVIWNLKMLLGRKLAVSLVFATGIFCVVFASFRIASSVTYLNSFDVVYDGSATLLWAEGEMTLMFFVVCLPSIPKATSGVKSMDICWIFRLWASSSTNTKGTGKSNLRPRSSSTSRNTISYRKADEYSLDPLNSSQKAPIPHRAPSTENVDWSTGIVRTTGLPTIEEQVLYPLEQHQTWV